MEKTEILLKKRHGKFVLYLFAAFLSVMAVLGSIAKIISSGFEWSPFVVGLIMLACLAFLTGSLMQYLSYGSVWLVVESDGETITFYNKNQAGKIFNKSEQIKLMRIKNFYIIKKRTRYLSNNYAFGYDKGKVLSNEEISAFPSLFEASQFEMQSVLRFVQTVRPEIELGYENFFQRLGKR